jgi:integrase
MFLTGVRIGSATVLDWSDVDLAKGTVILRKPKGQDDATAYLPPVLVAALANFPTRRGRVFGWQGRWSVYKPWRSVCRAAGLLYIPPHRAGRHGFATGLFALGLIRDDRAARRMELRGMCSTHTATRWKTGH